MSSNAVKYDKFYTYADYCKIDDDKRYEIINGVIYLMTAPNRVHQKISVNLVRKIGNYLEGKPCEVYNAPFDVILPKKGESNENSSTTVQPDILVVCDKNKLNRRGCSGAPDFIIEILSPSTGARDMKEKFNLYQENGVREYWIVDPVHQIIDRFHYDETLKEYKKPEYFSREDTISPIIFPELQIKLDEIFIEEDYDDE
jgi:Uma2 family endonuclease